MSKNGGVDVKALRAALKAKGVKFGGRAGVTKLVELAEANKVSVPSLKGGAGMIADEYRKKYGKAQNNGDKIAKALKDATSIPPETGKGRPTTDEKAMAEIAKDNGVKQYSAWKSSNLNVGQRRMNLGNVLRGMHNKGIKVVIGKTVFKGEAQGAGGKL